MRHAWRWRESSAVLKKIGTVRPTVISFGRGFYSGPHVDHNGTFRSICAHLADPFLANFSGKDWAKPVPPKSNGFVANIDAAFIQQILYLLKRKWKPNIHHNGQPDDLWARLEISEGAVFCYPAALSVRTARLNKFSSDNSQQTHIRADI